MSRIYLLLCALAWQFGAPSATGAAAASATACSTSAAAWSELRRLSALLSPDGAPSPRLPAERQLQLLDRLAPLYTSVRAFTNATRARAAALSLRAATRDAAPPASPFAVLKEHAALVQDLRAARQHGAAAAALAAARAALGVPRSTRRNAGVSPALFLDAALLQMAAHIADCRGSAAEAVAALDAARRLLATAPPPPPAGAGGARDSSAAEGTDPLAYAHVLHKAAWEEEAERAENATVAARFAPRFRAAAAALVARGPWRHPQQLPKQMLALPQWSQRPWFSESEEGDSDDAEGSSGGEAAGRRIARMTLWPALLAPVARLLHEAAPALAAEYAALAAAGALEEEADCIHTATAAAAASAVAAGIDAATAGLAQSPQSPQHPGGRWRVLTVSDDMSHPPEALDAACCAAASAPVACALLARVAAMRAPAAVTVLRGGYSAVGAHTRLRPHFGRSNAQIKLHVGLIVPTADGARGAAALDASGGAVSAAAASAARGAPCSWLRVGNETRGWRQPGQIFAFDDSWEHELRNDCAAERVVFQLVLAHPELPPAASREFAEGPKAA